MPVKTYAEQLEDVQATIARIEEKGQDYTVGGRSLTRADLKTLYAREEWLRKRVAREQRGGVRTQFAVPCD